jgi:hypothetical protein
MGKPAEEILHWVSSVVTIPFLLTPLSYAVAYNKGSSDRWYRAASVAFFVRMLAGLMLLCTGGFLMFAYAWPRSLWGILVAAAATALLWRWFCRVTVHGLD